MLKRMKTIFGRICVPDELDMIEHYRTPAEKTADLVVHVVGLTLAAVGGIVLAVLAAIYSGVGAVVATAAYALCLIVMLTVSTIYNQTRRNIVFIRLSMAPSSLSPLFRSRQCAGRAMTIR